MGNFEGHALPGSFFIVFALWWTVQIFHRYFTCRQKRLQFTSTPTYSCECLCGRAKAWPLESLIKLFFVGVGFSLEIYTGFKNGHIIPENAQHATMFFFFGLTGVMDLLLYFRFPVLRDLDYVSMIFAVVVEGILFKFHLHGRDGIDVLVHTLLVYTIIANVLAVMAEMKWRHNILAALARTYFIFLQGTWFWQIGFILHNPLPGAKEWSPEDHHSFLLITMYYVWHCGLTFITMLCIGGWMAYFHKKIRNGNDIEMGMKPLMKIGTRDHKFAAVNRDSDNSEFEQ
ncbi:transmembrane protein 45B-like [Mizuhopecten yessoensis]|uniref:transmembrane protein 45B-like n=1 Tax=Mizuhopecten yessoensis TaxID=6573 RepID=UPI000B458BA0|nr:transmembrane protein 45B-like [Mizuhopecten yessoensis]XP_021378983.1 transmembrane protein 45B-like [Mizuhopecten yessoensis]XP_021378991.1 transmembrane protein 45B-like [Mizuhopecten yessoensis]XP_021379003.1 transmembrane protein 45B-like [Mizuhopecten yessoensis]XP_021379011.1 transmembrane protein 45B-like [Mizuhopecten yessoensis]XP_021379018.1 transmembrane protein 45B-like [Mizuhopecten yessoensis]XP_021379027.1 transmembrane protein 45B-like [Mizuhopecten yessoensis]XP_02137903